MRPLRTDSRRWLAPALIAVALLMRLLVPQGWMPSPIASGWTLTLCSGSGAIRVPAAALSDAALAIAVAESAHDHGATALSHGSDNRSGEHQGAQDHPCAFAAAAHALDWPGLPPALAALPPAAALFVPAALGLAIGRGLAAPPPPATGPPVRT